MQQCPVTKYTNVRYDYCSLFRCQSKRQNWVSYLLNTMGILLHANSFLYFFRLRYVLHMPKKLENSYAQVSFFVIKSSPTLLVLFDMFEFICCCCSLPKSCASLFNLMDYSTPAPLSSTICWSLLKFMSIESVMLSNHFILCCPLLSSIFPSIRVFSDESALEFI